MSYYEDISVCKTEAELLALWKTKKATTGHYMEKKQEKEEKKAERKAEKQRTESAHTGMHHQAKG